MIGVLINERYMFINTDAPKAYPQNTLSKN